MKNEPIIDDEASDIVQLNARVPKRVRSVHKSIAAVTGMKMEELAADALRFFYGVNSPDLLERREQCARHFKALTRGNPIPFDSARLSFTTTTASV